jgi:antitoxin ParD1/3/4
MNVSLTSQLEKLVNKKVSSGLYHSASEVIREGLRLLKEHDEVRQQRLRELRHSIAIGLRQANQDQMTPLDIRAIHAAIKRKAPRRNSS